VTLIHATTRLDLPKIAGSLEWRRIERFPLDMSH
jgi:hypothetical protein